ncbi:MULTISPECIES: signal recognition particle protein [Chromobacterium]|uniref:Signal recognition particle protein n=1 Tax=Chromobacterium haemolyticum TaxID=394935 RepID=A0ABS3GN29_9NEIS|nr:MULTISPECIES: signal recognition particle protein [Chromobacterium]MBK0414879.1 signal recognition particle protein [Chromobacterium haemolyticum]MBO0416451.1 signal recognition particle protein [Chromobacterium haemolyticum]MBO0499518.1 signal recognition particle protein [Chromobacterium haemolyticum]QOZ82780.1 signal recognition particle protein [Chromobacterium sp. Rain0013]WON82850.1 signal recognition particle protein [Chromobacterium haemolyticum]
MLDNLTSRLSGVMKNLRGNARLTEANIQDAMREVRMALLEADVALPVVKTFIAQVKERALGQDVAGSLTPGQALVGVVNEELTKLMGEKNDALNLAAVPPAIVLMAGLQGAGKTTTVGKLAKLLKETQKKKVLVVSADVYRPAAIEQLKLLAQQVEVEWFPSSGDQNPVDIARAAVDHAKRHFFDVLMVDTAGRLAIDEAMMAEIKALHAALNPVETLFVVDAMQGQDAVNTAQAFNEALPLTGVILTKMDGDSRGGAALSVRHITGKPIKFIGVGEKVSGLEPFHPDRIASRILGMGDVLSLIEEVQKGIDQDEAAAMAKKLKSGKGFDLEDFKAQMQQMKKMGGMSNLLEKMPGQLGQMAKGVQGAEAEKAMRRIEGIINSMTPQERHKPELLKASRKRRIAAGAGVTVQEVNKLLNQFEQTQKMMKQFSSKGGMMKMLRGMKGMMPGM